MIAISGLGGCATSRDVRSAEGWLNRLIDCSGPTMTFGHCIEKAGDVCGGRGFTVLGQKGGELPKSNAELPTGGLLDTSIKYEDGKLSLPFEGRKLYIRCN